ncbi:MAG TPA: hypothetical protein VIM14_19565 [Polyangia bacterium]
MRTAGVLALSAAALLACRRGTATAPASSTASVAAAGSHPGVDGGAPPAHARFKIGWSPVTGKGDVVETLASGDLVRTCFHCAYSGYTGGLVIGNMNGSGMGFYPRKPLRGFKSINVFCAQDESIWDLDEKAEYSYGWSENIGTGADGKRLEYVGGRILEHGDDHVILASENAGGCYRVFKVAFAKAAARTWIIATRIQNRCDKPVHFDLWTGDDPWIGLYASSEGDVGWTPQGLVRNETAFGMGQFTAGGLYDLGKIGEKPGSFSNQANFFALDPALPLPDFAAFANRFAHGSKDVDPRRPLDNKTMTALNLGWRARTLGPGESMDMAMALGMASARDGDAGETLPQLPVLTDADWSTWRRFMKSPSSAEQVLFASEIVELHLAPGELTLEAVYHLHNPSAAGQVVSIAYPILVSSTSPAPTEVTVDGEILPVEIDAKGQAAVHFQRPLEPRALRSFAIRYKQKLLGPSAGYMVTSARRWPQPLDRAVFVVEYPATWKDVRVSYPVRHRETKNGRTTLTMVEQPFLPDREVTVRWRDRRSPSIR